MPKGLLQEKFQRTVKRGPKEDHSWKSFESTRTTHDHPKQMYRTDPLRAASVVGGCPPELTDFSAPKTNELPPGMNITHQGPGVGSTKDGGLAGSTDVSNSVNDSMLMRGYQRQNMHSADEMYTNEHTEEFYGDATVDGETGFVERNNYLDRT